MDMNELLSLEEKSKEIVATLGALKEEVATYQKRNLGIEEAFEGLSELTRKISDASADFLSIIQMLEKSDLGKAAGKLDSMISHLDARYSEIISTEKNIEQKQNDFMTAVMQRQDILANGISLLMEMVGRIDRNTQKGFGKERC